MHPERLGEYVWREREKIYPSRRVFAQSIGLDPGTVEDIENGYTKSPGLKAVLAIADGLKVSPMKLISIYRGENPEKEVEETTSSSQALQEIINVLLKTVPHKRFAEALIQQDGEEKVRQLLEEAKRRHTERHNKES